MTMLDEPEYVLAERQLVGEQRLTDPPGPHPSWEPASLGALMRGLADGTLELPAPTIGYVEGDHRGLAYRGRVNGLTGKGGDGKTWIAGVIAAHQVSLGRGVWWIDFEDSPLGTADRLVALGADPDLIDRHLRYVHPGAAFDLISRARTVDALTVDGTELVVIDSTGEWMAIEGVQTNVDESVASWFHDCARPLAAAGPAVLAIDHLPHNAEGRMAAIGSIRKYNAIDGASYVIEPLAEFGRERLGRSRLTVAKDRLGHRPRGSTAAEFTLDATTSPYLAALALPAARPTDDSPMAREKPAVRRVASILEAADQPLTVSAIGDALAVDGTGIPALKARTIQDALVRMRTLGLADSDDSGIPRWKSMRTTPIEEPGNAF